MDRKDLKIEGLLQKVSELTRQYEDALVDLRVELTVVMQELNDLRKAQSEGESAAGPADELSS